MAYGHDGGVFFGGEFMWLFWLLIIIVLVIAIKFFADNTTSKKAINESAMYILKQRYARGEIEDDEFARRKKELLK